MWGFMEVDRDTTLRTGQTLVRGERGSDQVRSTSLKAREVFYVRFGES